MSVLMLWWMLRKNRHKSNFEETSSSLVCRRGTALQVGDGSCQWSELVML